MMKKRRWLIPTAMLLIGIATANVETFEYEGLTYNTLTDATAEVAPNNKAAGKLVVPDCISRGNKQWRVTTIGEGVFSECQQLTDVYVKSKHFEEQFRWGDLFSAPTYYFGRLVETVKGTGSALRIALPQGAVYIVKAQDRTFKIGL